MSSRTIYTVHANGKAVYHGINRQDAEDIAWIRLLEGERVEVQENPYCVQ